jgi:hypothetical protein
MNDLLVSAIGVLSIAVLIQFVVIYRLIACRRGDAVHLLSKHEKSWDPGRLPPKRFRMEFHKTDYAPMDRDLELTLISILSFVCLWGRGNSDGNQAAAMDFAAMCDELHNVPEWLASRDASKETQFLQYFEKLDRPWANLLRNREYPRTWRERDPARGTSLGGSGGDA